MLEEYFIVFIYFGVAIFLSCLIVLLPQILAKKIANKSKLSPYECGFGPEEGSKKTFEIRFYLVAILFIIFDLEIIFLIPWAVSLKKIGIYGFWSMMFFLFTLTIGFIYEWKKGALEWE